jgi:carbon monoxide dehydrogenase subunit G
MALRFEQSFVVKAPRDRVWSYLVDPYRVVTALPGAAITEKVDETTYNGTITVKVGPVSARYRGTVRFEKLDAAACVAEVAASGQETSGKGGADLKMTSRLAERAPGETEATVVSEVNVTGILAQFGRGMMQDVSDQMFQKFTDAVRAALERPAGETGHEAAAAPAAPAAPIDVASLGSQVAGRALLRAARRPLVWAVLAAVLLAIYWLVSR